MEVKTQETEKFEHYVVVTEEFIIESRESRPQYVEGSRYAEDYGAKSIEELQDLTRFVGQMNADTMAKVVEADSKEGASYLFKKVLLLSAAKEMGITIKPLQTR